MKSLLLLLVPVPFAAPKKVTFVSTLDFLVVSVVYTSLFRLVVAVVDSM